MPRKVAGPSLFDGLFTEQEPFGPAEAVAEVRHSIDADVAVLETEEANQPPAPIETITPEDAPADPADTGPPSGFALFGHNLFGEEIVQDSGGPLASRFTLPPFTILDARQGPWQERKRAWLALGIQSELGRGSSAIQDHQWQADTLGEIKAPHTAVDKEILRRAEQQSSYKSQDKLNSLQKTGKSTASAIPETPVGALSPIERVGSVWVKRDDLFEIAGVRGGKVRTCWVLSQGAKGLVTAGSRSSPQANIVAQIAKRLGVPCRVHTPQGELSPEVQAAADAGAEVVQHPAGYNNVIIKRANDDAAERGWTCIPFGMECAEAIWQTQNQVCEIPDGVKRIVVPVGSGMSMAGILQGLMAAQLTVPVLGVIVGADPEKRLDEYAPTHWRLMAQLEKSPLDYDRPMSETIWHGIHLDPIYEAKCTPFLRPDDLFWIVGIRMTAAPLVKRRARKDRASPGGSPRPACDYTNKERGDGHGRPLT